MPYRIGGFHMSFSTDKIMKALETPTPENYDDKLFNFAINGFATRTRWMS